MKKKLLLVLLATVVLSLGTVLLTACTHEHTWSEWTVGKQATCTEEGERSHTCTSCDEIETEKVDALGHNFSAEWTHDESKHWHICSVCSAKDAEADHTMVDQECSVCGYEVYTANLTYTLSEDGESYSVSGENLTENDKILRIPETYEGLPVTTIPEDAFTDNDYIEKVFIPDSILLLEDYAFEDCNSITSLSIGNGITVIDFYAFIRCTSLTSVVIPDSVEVIRNGAFLNCSSLTSVTFGSRVKSIWDAAFSGCDNLTGVVIPKSVTSIGVAAFGYDSVKKLTVDENNTSYKIAGDCLIEIETKTLISGCSTSVIPTDGSVEIIGERAFYRCSELESITIPNSVTTTSTDSFEECPKLKTMTIGSGMTNFGMMFGYFADLEKVNYLGDIASWCNIEFASEYCNPAHFAHDLYINDVLITDLVIPEGVEKIHTSAFQSFKSIASISFPSSLTEIGTLAFANCDLITSVVIPANVKKIGYSAFNSCYNLTEVTFQSGDLEIEEYAFRHCNKLETVKHLGTLASWISIHFDAYDANPMYLAEKLYINNQLITDFVIPDGVTEIGDYTFAGLEQLTSLVMPDSVTKIGAYAFLDCINFEEITLSENLIVVTTGAFNECTSLKYNEYENAIYLGTEGNPYYYLKSVEPSPTETYVIHDSTKVIGEEVFRSKYTLDSITLPEGLKAIGKNAFRFCCSLTEIEIPEGVVDIADGAFVSCEKLVEVYNRSSLNLVAGSEEHGSIGLNAKNIYTNTSGESKLETTADGYVFMNADDGYYLVDYVGTDLELFLPEGYKDQTYEIHDHAFYANKFITSVVIPSKVTSIGEWAFRECANLVLVEVGDDVTSIGSYAFYESYKLAKITIGSSVTEIGDDAFSSYRLVEVDNRSSAVTVRNTIREVVNTYTPTSGKSCMTRTTSGHIFYNNNGVDYLIGYVGTDCTLPADYNGHSYAIDAYAFYGDTNITTVVIPEGVTSLGLCAFYECPNLTSVVIPSSVTEIDGAAFGLCPKLESITVQSGNTYYKSDGNCLIDIAQKSIIAGCKTSVIPSDGSVEIIGIYAFQGSGITSIVIPDCITLIDAQAFTHCEELTSIIIPDNVTAIGIYAFSECYKLESVVIGNNVTTIGNHAFTHCESLTSITLGDKLTTIDNFAFSYCKSLTSIVIPDSVTRIGNGVFDQCQALKSVEIADGVTSIGNYAFYGCQALTSIVIPDSVMSIGDSVFSSCISLKYIVFSNSVTSVGANLIPWGYALEAVYYIGTAEEFANTGLLENFPTMPVYYYSESQPTEEGNYWHYVENEPTIWTKAAD